MDLMTWLRAEWDRVLGFTLIGLGAILLVLGYIGVSDSPYVAEQLSYIVSGGLGGLFLLGAGATLLILADLHDEWRKLDRVEAILSGQIPFPDAGADQRAGPLPGAGADSRAAPVGAPAGNAPAVMRNGRHDPAPAPGAAAVEVSTPAGPTAAAVLRRERFSLGLGLLLGVAVLFGSWARSSSVDQPKQAIAAVGIAIFGLVLVALGAVGSTLTVKRHVQLRKARVFSAWLGPRRSGAGCPRRDAGARRHAGHLARAHPLPPGRVPVGGRAARHGPSSGANLPSGLAACHLCDAGEIHLPPPTQSHE